jgi:thioredoxin reductase (NADPH)
MRHMSESTGRATAEGLAIGQSLHFPETPDTIGAYPRLTEDQIRALDAHGERRAVRPGEVLFHDGDQWSDFFVVTAGKVAIVEGYECLEERLLVVHGPGRFLGELSLLTGQASLYSAVVVEPGEILAVPVGRVRDLLTKDAVLGDLILRAYLIRRSLLIGLGTGMRIIGSRYSPDVRRLRDFAARNRIPYRWVDLEDDPGTESLLQQLGVEPEDTPIVILFGKQLLRTPSNAELAAAISQSAPAPSHDVCDLVVVGAGPAGLSAAVYGASDGLATVVLDAVATGGQAGTSSQIENYLGFPTGISGAELAERAVIQAEKFGAEITVPAQATSLDRAGNQFLVGLGDGATIQSRSVVVASGAKYRRLQVPRLEKFEATSVYYAASQVEAQLCRGDPVAIVGGGNSAGQAAIFLAKHAERIWLLVREPELSANMSRYLVDQVTRTEQIDVLCQTEVRELIGDSALTGLLIANTKTSGCRELRARALFVFIGAEPATSWLSGLVALDENGFVLTGPAAAIPAARMRAPEAASPRSALETSLPGLFAAGDVRSGSTKRVASAVGEGAMAIHLVHERMHFG